MSDRTLQLLVPRALQAALGAHLQLQLGECPGDLQGIGRNGETIFEKLFLTGEDNMPHSLASLEAHHSECLAFCRQGDVHARIFGTATLSCADDVQPQAGDIIGTEAALFTLMLRHPLAVSRDVPAKVRVL
jgi:hypothetical protein